MALREGRAERGADLDDRALPSDRRAGADRQGGSKRLHHRHLPADIAVLVEDRIHHLRHAVAFGFRGEILDNPHDDQAADDRREEHPVAEALWSLEDVGVVAETEDAEIRGVVNDRDQRAQGHSADARDDSDREREQTEREQADAPLIAPDRRRCKDGPPGEVGGMGCRVSHVGHRLRMGSPAPAIHAPRTQRGSSTFA